MRGTDRYISSGATFR